MSYETIQRADTKNWLGLHGKGGKKKPGGNGASPNKKTQKAVEAREKDWENTDSTKRGSCPGSQNPHKIRGK